MKFYSIQLALICVFVFILQLIIPNFNNAFILNQQSYQQPWRFLTAIFLHGSLQHLLLNMFALIFFGLVLERVVGSKKFLTVFLVSGVLANVISVNFYNSSLGASGAIYGVIGTLTILRPLLVVWAFSMPMPIFVASLLWVLIDVLGIGMPDNVGHLAHLSGILFGFILGFIFRVIFRATKKQENSKDKISIMGKVVIPEHSIRNWEDYYMRTF